MSELAAPHRKLTVLMLDTRVKTQHCTPHWLMAWIMRSAQARGLPQSHFVATDPVVSSGWIATRGHCAAKVGGGNFRIHALPLIETFDVL